MKIKQIFIALFALSLMVCKHSVSCEKDFVAENVAFAKQQIGYQVKLIAVIKKNE